MNDLISLSYQICEILIGPSPNAVKCCKIELGEKIFCQFKAYLNSILNMLDIGLAIFYLMFTPRQIEAGQCH